MSWTLHGHYNGFELIDATGRLLWSRSPRLEEVDADQPPESLTLLGMLAYANVPAALAAVPALRRR